MHCRALGCGVTVAYGMPNGTAFSDFTGSNPWPCGVDIRSIRIRHGRIIDAIQVTYKSYDQNIIHKPRRGGLGGTESLIYLTNGERITGVTGTICNEPYLRLNGPHVRQLVFFSEKADGQKMVYGPYGYVTSTSTPNACRVFAVNGKITSIFGREARNLSFTVLGAIGFYYEDESQLSQSTS